VVVIVRYFGRGKESGLDVKGANIDAHVWTVRNGKAVSLRMYQGTGDPMRTRACPRKKL
jgi:ketosteroid isomerase-like protein